MSTAMETIILKISFYIDFFYKIFSSSPLGRNHQTALLRTWNDLVLYHYTMHAAMLPDDVSIISFNTGSISLCVLDLSKSQHHERPVRSCKKGSKEGARISEVKPSRMYIRHCFLTWWWRALLMCFTFIEFIFHI